MKKLALFDFCGTLVSFQTADAFIDFVREKNGSSRMMFLNMLLVILRKIMIIRTVNKFFPYSSIEKKIKLLQLKNLSYERLNNLAALYYNEKIKPCLIAPVLKDLLRLETLDYEICIASAAYSIYLKYFAEEHKVLNIISTDIAFNKLNDKCLAKIVGKDCIYSEKARRIRIFFENQQVNYAESISYSDNLIDLPMLSLTGKSVVVSRSQPQLWVNRFGFNEILWE